MSFSGMDLHEVENLAAQLQAQANVVHGVVAEVDRAVTALAGVWEGDDLHLFSGLWNKTHRARAQAAGDEIVGLVTQLRQEAEAQRLTSGGHGVGSVHGDAPGIVGTWEYALMGIAGVFDKGKDVVGLGAGFLTRYYGRLAPRDELGRFVKVGRLAGRDLLHALDDPRDFLARSEKTASTFTRWSKVEDAVKLGKLGKLGGPVGVGISAATSAWSQWVDDSEKHPGMNDGEKVERAVAVGAGGAGGAAAGVAGGALVGFAVGGPVGAVVGGAVGGFVGSEAGETTMKMVVDWSLKPGAEELDSIAHGVSSVGSAVGDAAGAATHVADGAARAVGKALHFWQ